MAEDIARLLPTILHDSLGSVQETLYYQFRNKEQIAAELHRQMAVQVKRTAAPPLGPMRPEIFAGYYLSAIDANGELVGGQDHARQAEQAFLNLRTALAAVGATPADLLTYTVHVVDHRLDLVDPVYSAARRAFGGELPRTASTYLGVARLGLPEWLIEISGIAILP